MKDKLNQRLCITYTKMLYAVMWYVYNVVGYLMHLQMKCLQFFNSCEIKGFNLNYSVWKTPS